jgi:hypothetical protein
MYSLLLFEYSRARADFSQALFVNPLDRTSYTHTIPAEFHKSFIALLLQTPLHNFIAAAPITQLDRMAYRQECPKSRKSNAALLLPAIFPVSPLLRYSYKKMGGGGLALRSLGVGGYPL